MKKRAVHRSGFEDRVSELLRKARVPFSFESETLEYTVTKKYIPDFIVIKNKKKIYVECKGWFKPSDRTKMLSVKKNNPKCDIRFWFQADNYLTKAKKVRYSDWAIKHGFEYHVGEDLPPWLKSVKK